MVILACLSGGLATAQAAETFHVNDAALRCDDQFCYLEANLDYHFGEQALAALRQGIPLTVAIDFRLEQWRRHLWNRVLDHEVLRVRIRYLPFAKLVQVTGPDDRPRNYVTFDVGLRAAGQLQGFPIIRSARVRTDRVYQVKLHAWLDFERLPVPLRISAYLNPAWYHSSAWVSFLYKR